MTGEKVAPKAVASAQGAQKGKQRDQVSFETNTKQALGYIKAHCAGWQPEWFVQVVAIEPDGPIKAKAVHPDQIDSLEPWIAQHNGKANLYFAVNPLHRDPGKKCSLEDMAALAYVHVDLDPPKVKLTPAELAAEKQRQRTAVDAFGVKPTKVDDTGNGLAVYYQLEEPVPCDGNAAALGDTNRRVARALGGDAGATDISRVMRLRGTLNLPTKAKAELERPVSQSRLLSESGNTCALSDFAFLPPVAAKTQATMPATSIGTPIRLDDYGLPDKQAALVAGTLPKGQRSEVMLSLLCGLLDDGNNRDDVLATIYAEPGLQDYCASKHPSDPEAFALAELERAWSRSMPGILAGLVLYNPAWAEPGAMKPSTAPPFGKAPLAVAIRFDAMPITLDELDAEDPPLQYVIAPIYPLGMPGEFDGAHGIGKSINGLVQGCCVAAGRAWHGLPVMQGRVVFASWEDPRRQIMRRVKTWLRNITDPLERAKAKRAIAENLIVLGCDEIDLMLTTKSFGVCTVRDDVIELITERCQGAVLVMLETAALMHGGDELNEDLAQLAKAVKLITNCTGAAVITIRHVSKEAARNRIVDAYIGRGGGSFTGAMRTMVVLVDVPDEVVRKKCIGTGHPCVVSGRPVLGFHHVKANYGEKLEEPVYLVVMPDGHMERVTGLNAAQAHSDQLLEWLRENAPPEGLSFTKIRNASKKHGVKQDLLREMLETLERRGRARRVTAQSRGAKGEAEIWQLVELV